MPRAVERSAIAKVIATQPLLARFLDHRLSVEGGRRGLKPANETQWQVSRLVYRDDETVAMQTYCGTMTRWYTFAVPLLKAITYFQSLRKWVPSERILLPC